MNCATTSQEDKGFNSKLVRLKKVGDIVFVKVTHRLNLQVPTQIVSVDHNVRVGSGESAVTTTVQLLTL